MKQKCAKDCDRVRRIIYCDSFQDENHTYHFSTSIIHFKAQYHQRSLLLSG